MKRRHLLTLALSTAGLAACRPLLPLNQADQDDELLIWWDRGHYAEQGDAIEKIVSDWEEASGHRARLWFINSHELDNLTTAVAAGHGVPDVVYGHWVDYPITPLLARQGKLADLSAQVRPLVPEFLPGIEASVTYTGPSGRRGIYAAPFAQEVANIHFWQDLIDNSGLGGKGIPTDWAGFWRFWREVQTGLRRNGFSEVHGIGLPMSAKTQDTGNIFECFLEAHGVEIFSHGERNSLSLGRSENRSRLIAALEDYSGNYLQGYVPIDAINWLSDGNNNSFLSTLSAMTINPSLSIPGAMTADEMNYRVRLKSLAWPKRLDGQVLRPIASISRILAFRQSPRLAQARSFIAHFLQPAVTDSFIRGSQGRFVPVLQPLLNNNFWSGSSDPHIEMQRRMVQQSQPSRTVSHPAYSQVARQNLWGEAIHSIATRTLSAPEAADQAIARISSIVNAWP